MAHPYYNQSSFPHPLPQQPPQQRLPPSTYPMYSSTTQAEFSLPGLGFLAQEEDATMQQDPLHDNDEEDDEDEDYYGIPSLKHDESVGQDSRVAAITTAKRTNGSEKSAQINGNGVPQVTVASHITSLNGRPLDAHQVAQSAPSDFSLPGLGSYTSAPTPTAQPIPQSSKNDLLRLLETQYSFAVQTLRDLHACGISFEQLTALDLLDTRDKANLAELFVQAGLSDGGIPSVRSLNQELLSLIAPPSENTNGMNNHSDGARSKGPLTSSVNGMKTAAIDRSNGSVPGAPYALNTLPKQQSSGVSPNPSLSQASSVQPPDLSKPSVAPTAGGRTSYLQRLQEAKGKKSPQVSSQAQASVPVTSLINSATIPSSNEAHHKVNSQTSAGLTIPQVTVADSGAKIPPPSAAMNMKERLKHKMRQLREEMASDPVASASSSVVAPTSDNDLSVGGLVGTDGNMAKAPTTGLNTPANASDIQHTDTPTGFDPAVLPGLSALPSENSMTDAPESEADSDEYEPSGILPPAANDMPMYDSGRDRDLNLTPSAFVRQNPMDFAYQSNPLTPGGTYTSRPMDAALKSKEAELLEMKARLKAKLDQKRRQEQLALDEKAQSVSAPTQGKTQAEPIDLTEEDAPLPASTNVKVGQPSANGLQSLETAPERPALGMSANEAMYGQPESASASLLEIAQSAISGTTVVSPEQPLAMQVPDTGAMPQEKQDSPAGATAPPTMPSLKRSAPDSVQGTPSEKRSRPSTSATPMAGTPASTSAKAKRMAEMQRQMLELQAAMAAAEDAEDAEEGDDLEQTDTLPMDPVPADSSFPAQSAVMDTDEISPSEIASSSHLPSGVGVIEGLTYASQLPVSEQLAQDEPDIAMNDAPLQSQASEENVPMEIEEIEISSDETSIDTSDSEAGGQERVQDEVVSEIPGAETSDMAAAAVKDSDAEDGELDEYEPSMEITPIIANTAATSQSVAPGTPSAPAPDQETRRKSLTDESMAESSEEGEISSGVEEVTAPPPRAPPTQPRNFNAGQRQPHHNDQSPRGPYAQQNRRPPMHHGGPPPRFGGQNGPARLPILGVSDAGPPKLTKTDSIEGKDVVDAIKSSAGSFKKYESPLKVFKSFRFHPEYTKTEGGYQSLTYSHKLRDDIALCPNELSRGACDDQTCPYQHIGQVQLDGSSLLAELGGQNPGQTEEERQTYIQGLRKLIQDMKARKLESAEQIASEIVAYRREFLQDPTRILAFGEPKEKK